MGYSIHHDFEGKGLMYEALQAAVKYAFDEKHLHRIMANHLPENQRNANMPQRLGFQVDGISPNYLYIQGKWREHVFNSLTNENWQPRKEDKALFGIEKLGKSNELGLTCGVRIP